MFTILKRTNYGSFFHLPQFGELDLNIVNSRKVNNTDHGVVFRWGCTTKITASVGVINHSKSIRLAANKPATRKVLIEQGIQVPETLFNPREASEWLLKTPEGSLIGRPASHSMGRNFHLIQRASGIQESVRLGDMYWSEFVPKNEELRVFVFFGKVILVARKHLREGKHEVISWNSENASFRNVRWSNWNIEALKLSIQTIKALNLHFGAVDLIRKSNTNNFYVLEVNTSPGITSNYRMVILVNCLRWLINSIDDGGEIPEVFPLPLEGGYGQYIHPSIYK